MKTSAPRMASARVPRSWSALVKRLASASEVQIGGTFSTEGAVNVVTPDAKIYIPMNELVDFEAERARLNKELKKAEKDLAFFSKKLNNPGYLNNAPAAVIEKDRASAAKAQEHIDRLNESLAKLG